MSRPSRRRDAAPPRAKYTAVDERAVVEPHGRRAADVVADAVAGEQTSAVSQVAPASPLVSAPQPSGAGRPNVAGAGRRRAARTDRRGAPVRVAATGVLHVRPASPLKCRRSRYRRLLRSGVTAPTSRSGDGEAQRQLARRRRAPAIRRPHVAPPSRLRSSQWQIAKSNRPTWPRASRGVLAAGISQVVPGAPSGTEMIRAKRARPRQPRGSPDAAPTTSGPRSPLVMTEQIRRAVGPIAAGVRRRRPPVAGCAG